MGFLGGMMSGAKGANYQAQGQAGNIQLPTTSADAQAAQAAAQQGMYQQQQFLTALQNQNGVGNQSMLFNQMGTTGGMLQNLASGQGPNPAQSMLAQNTGQNVNTQAALMAGQRGAGANVGLMARQAAQQGAATQQQAIGQAATMQAQQQIAAIGQLQQNQSNQAALAGQMVNQQGGTLQNYNNLAQGEQGMLLNSIGSQNNANVAMQSNLNNANAGIAQGNQKGQQQLVSNLTNSAGSAIMAAKGGMVPHFADGGQAAPSLGVNTQLPTFQAPSIQAATPTPGKPKSKAGNWLTGDQLSQQQDAGLAPAGQAIGTGLGMGLKAGFQAIKGLFSKDSGPDISQGYDAMNPDDQAKWDQSMQGSAGTTDVASPTGPSSVSQGLVDMPNYDDGGPVQMAMKLAPLAMMLAQGGKVPAKVSPGEIYLSPDKVAKVANSDKKGKKILQEGERIPGKAKVKGDSLKNDTVDKTLDEGGIVVPRSKATGKDVENKAAAFVQAILAHKKGLK